MKQKCAEGEQLKELQQASNQPKQTPKQTPKKSQKPKAFASKLSLVPRGMSAVPSHRPPSKKAFLKQKCAEGEQLKELQQATNQQATNYQATNYQATNYQATNYQPNPYPTQTTQGAMSNFFSRVYLLRLFFIIAIMLLNRYLCNIYRLLTFSNKKHYELF
ncbi:MAG: hypothetical protein R3Y08_00315 [Rikenellaceae bacterium]